MIKNFLRFSHMDYCLPHSLQKSKIQLLNKPGEILKYSRNAIKEANPKIDKSDLSPDNIRLALILNTELNYPKDFNPLSFPQLATHPDFQHKFEQFVKTRPKNLTDVQKAILSNTFNLDWADKIQFTEIDNYEELWHVIKWKQHSFLTDEETDWIIEQNQKIISNNKMDLHFLSLIFELLCERNENFGKLWEHFDVFVDNYFHSFAPKEILTIMRGFSIKIHFILYQFSWIHCLKRLHHSYFDQYSTEELFEYIELADSLNISVHPTVIARAKEEAVHQAYNNLHIWAKYKSLRIDRTVVLELLQGLDIVSKFRFFNTLIYMKIEKSLFTLMVESLAPDIQEVPIKLLFKTSWLLYSKQRATKEFYELLLHLEPRLSSLNFQETIQLIDIFIKQKVPIHIQPEYLDKICNNILKSSENINSTNICIISKFFCLMYPNEKIQERISQILIESEVPDSIKPKRPAHQFFQILKPNEFLVLNNSILVNMDFTRALNIISSLYNGRPASPQLKSILNKYMKVLAGRCYFKLDLKFRIELAEILANPEYFDKEVFSIFIQRLKQNMIYNNKPRNHKKFFSAICELSSQGHSDKELKELFGLNSLNTT